MSRLRSAPSHDTTSKSLSLIRIRNTILTRDGGSHQRCHVSKIAEKRLRWAEDLDNLSSTKVYSAGPKDFSSTVGCFQQQLMCYPCTNTTTMAGYRRTTENYFLFVNEFIMMKLSFNNFRKMTSANIFIICTFFWNFKSHWKSQLPLVSVRTVRTLFSNFGRHLAVLLRKVRKVKQVETCFRAVWFVGKADATRM